MPNLSIIRKRPLLVLNIVIAVCYLILTVPFIVVMATHNPPTDLKTATGTISEFKHHDKNNPNFIDYLINDSASYFNVSFTDGSFFTAVGIRYNNIDEKLFSDISVGSEITVIYEDGGFSAPDSLYGIEYNGITYLNTEDVLTDFKAERKTTITGCSIAISILTVIAIVAFILTYIKNRRKPMENVNA